MSVRDWMAMLGLLSMAAGFAFRILLRIDRLERAVKRLLRGQRRDRRLSQRTAADVARLAEALDPVPADHEH